MKNEAIQNIAKRAGFVGLYTLLVAAFIFATTKDPVKHAATFVLAEAFGLCGFQLLCKVVKDTRHEFLEQGIRQGMEESALRMLAAGKYSLEEIANISRLSLGEVEQLKDDEDE